MPQAIFVERRSRAEDTPWRSSGASEEQQGGQKGERKAKGRDKGQKGGEWRRKESGDGELAAGEGTEEHQGGQKGDRRGKGRDKGDVGGKGKGKDKGKGTGKGKDRRDDEGEGEGSTSNWKGGRSEDRGEGEAKGKGKGNGKGKGKAIGPQVGRDAAADDFDELDGSPAGAVDEAVCSPAASGYLPIRRDASWSLRERLVLQMKRASYECMVCMSRVGTKAPVWSCKSCSAVFHMKCTKDWIKKSNEGSQTNGREASSLTWPCPGCRYIHVERRLPDYTCFCGRLLEPEPSPHYTPHSCGESCERKREHCPHACPELCHPGPCPQCTAVGSPGACFCEREHKAATRCGEPTAWSCGEPCNRDLGCGKHKCPLRCHKGKCPPCSLSEEMKCHCRRTARERLCGSGAFGCGQVCRSLLSCGHHACERLCHANACGECRLAPEKWGPKCACGKSDASTEAAAAMLVRFAPRRSSCKDPFPLCGSICGRLSVSGCGHSCARQCHEGPCGPCGEIVTQACRCSQTERQIDCFTALSENSGVHLCNKVCRTRRSCGRHRCEELCCPQRDVREHEVHLCLVVCSRPLSCGEHVCEDFCHLGKCPPCRVVRRTPVTCACGASRLEPPVVCGTPLPECSRTCGHMLACGHTCRSACHQGEHPLCGDFVSKVCIGGHVEMPPSPCHVPASSCGRSCGAPKADCSHRCAKACHAGECPNCEEPCGAGRLHCEHRCQVECHGSEECPDEPCTAEVRVTCKCGVVVKNVMCGACDANRRPQRKNLPCGTGCRGSGQGFDARRDPHAILRFEGELVRLAERASAQFTRFYELKLEDLLPPARPGPKITVNLSRADVAAGRRPLAVELARVHYGLQHEAIGDQDGGLQLSIWAGGGSQARRPPAKLSELMAGGGDVVHFPPEAPSLRFVFAAQKAEEIAEELVYVLLCEEEPGAFRVRFSGSEGPTARFESAVTAASAFQRLTRQANSVDLQEVRRPPPSGAQRIAKLGARPRVELVNAKSALMELRQRAAPVAGAAASGTGGSVWAARASGGAAWGPKASAPAASPAPWGPPAKAAAPAAVAAPLAPARPAPAVSAAPAAQTAAKPTAEVPESWEEAEEVPDSWED